MHVQSFLDHWNISENPFIAEEARHDPVFHRLLDMNIGHPDFDKVYALPEKPSAAVVFGEKGSGKTALKLLLDRRIAEHNKKNPKRKVWVVKYDELNPILDRVAHHKHRYKPLSDEALLAQFKLTDHMDAILSLGTTSLIDYLLTQASAQPKGDVAKTLRRMPREKRVDLAQLAILYDSPETGSVEQRFGRLKKRLRLGGAWVNKMLFFCAALFSLTAGGLSLTYWLTSAENNIQLMLIGTMTGGAIFMFLLGAIRWLHLNKLAKGMRRQVRVVERQKSQLRQLLAEMPYHDLKQQPLPVTTDRDARYQLFARLVGILEELDYVSLIVLVDRIDEPAAVNGDTERMQMLVWPMLNNKFLQQEKIGIKLLLPIELRHLLYRESSEFFQRARLDKQHLVDRLNWSGPLLYDLCSRRVQACTQPGAEEVSLVDLFAEDVGVQDIVDALEQMHQPRDAFKFIYQVISEHCSTVPQDQPVWKIPRLTLDQIKRSQTRRVEELQRGLGPA